jgi:hypothetical protein
MQRPAENSEEAWCASQRAKVVAYLKQAQLAHGEVGEWPAWHVWPDVAVWAVESVARPGWVGWWVISGDLPTDYTPCGPARHPREGVRDIAQRWRAAAAQWEQGNHAQDWSIGSAENESALAPLLSSRASLLLSWVADDSLWPD